MSAAVSGGLPGRDPLPQREAVPGSRRHAVPGGGLAVHRLSGRRAGGTGGHLVRPHHRGQLQQRAAGECPDTPRQSNIVISGRSTAVKCPAALPVRG